MSACVRSAVLDQRRPWSTRRILFGAALVYFVLIGGTVPGELVPAIRALNAAVAGAFLILWIVRAHDADLVDGLVAVAAALFALASVFSAFPRQSLDAALAAVGYAAAFSVVRHELTDAQSRALAITLLALMGAALAVVMGLVWGSVWLTWLIWTDWTWVPPLDLYLPQGPWSHPHDVALLLALLAPAIWTIRSRRALAIAALPVLALIALIVFLEGSRNVWVAVGVGLVAAIALHIRRVGTPSRRVALAVAVALGLLAAAAVQVGAAAAVLRRLMGFDSLVARIDQWTDSLALWVQNPLQGWGPGSFPFLLRLTGHYDDHVFVSRHPDNALIQLVAEAGILGLGAAGLSVAALLVGIRRAGRFQGAPLWALLVAAIAAFGANPTDHGYFIAPIIIWAALATPPMRMIGSTTGRLRSLRHANLMLTALVGAAVLVLSLGSFAYERAAAAAAKRDYPAAIEAIEEAAALDPGMALYQRELGILRLLAGDARGAIAPLQRAVVMNSADDATWRVLAIAYGRGGDAEMSASAARIAVTRDAADYLNQLVLAEAAEALGLHEERASALSAVVLLAPWITAAPEWPEESAKSAIEGAVRRWREVGVGRSISPALLVAMGGLADERASAMESAGGLTGSAEALTLLFECRLGDALNTIVSVERREGTAPDYWPIRLLVERANGKHDRRSEVLAFVRIPELQPIVDARLGAGDWYSGGVQDRHAYRRSPLPHPDGSTAPLASRGLSEWLRDPFEAARRAAPASGLAGCTAEAGRRPPER